MNKIIIFGGTTEGRVLSGMLGSKGIEHTVSVASDYGSGLIEQGKFVHVHTGRMDEPMIADYLRRNGFGPEDIVIDATHPYADVATRNIAGAVQTVGCRLIRISRDISEYGGPTDDDSVEISLKRYDSAGECFAALDDTDGNILLTTGSKELKTYISSVSKETLHRTYVRVLPSIDSIKACNDEGIEPDKIIAMHGPFLKELNKALILQYGIKHLVTKQSGHTGGYTEKLKACIETGTDIYVIASPTEDDGISVYEAYREITGAEYTDESGTEESGAGRRTITLCGYGPGGSTYMTEEVRRAIDSAEIVFGAKRLISDIHFKLKYPVYKAADIIAVLDDKTDIRRIAILFSGDSGFYSGAQDVYDSLRKWDPDAQVILTPGVSAVSYMASACGVSYDDAAIISLHGHNGIQDMHRLTETIRYTSKTFVLTSGDKDVRDTASRLKDAHIDCRIIVGHNLSYEDNNISDMSVDEAAVYTGEGIITMLVLNPDHRYRPLINMYTDDEFIRGNIPMTKECVRHEVIYRLGLYENDVVYDIGGGTGSVAIETASLDPSLKVYTIEKNQEAITLIRQNIKAQNVLNVIPVEGEAPDALTSLEEPDAVFIGGSAGKLKEILSTLHTAKRGIRYVVTSVSVETSATINSFIETEQIGNAKIIQMQINDVIKKGSHHMMQANNPVMIYAFTW